jgi:hypothetical protein
MNLDALPEIGPDPVTIGWGTTFCYACERKITVGVLAWVAPDPEDPETELFCTEIDLTDLETHQAIHDLEDMWVAEPDDALIATEELDRG